MHGSSPAVTLAASVPVTAKVVSVRQAAHLIYLIGSVQSTGSVREANQGGEGGMNNMTVLVR